LRCLLREFDKAIPGQLEQNPYYQRWPYYAALIKHSFEVFFVYLLNFIFF